MKRKTALIFFLLGVAGVVILFRETDFGVIDWDENVWGLMPVWLPAILLIWAVIYFLHILSYRTILGEDKNRVSILFLIKLTLTGFALNEVTPVGLIGGEPYRIMELKPHIGVNKAVSTTLTFSVMHIFSHMLFLFTGTILYFILGCDGGVAGTVLVALTAVWLAFVIFMILMSGRHRVVYSTVHLLSKIPKLGKIFANLLEKNRETVRDIDSSMMEFHTRKKDFRNTTLLEFSARVLEASEFFFLLRIFGADVNFFESYVAVACASFLGNLLFLIPMQVGSREFGMALALGWAGVDPSFGVTASLLARIRGLIYISVGVALLLFKSKKRNTETKKD